MNGESDNSNDLLVQCPKCGCRDLFVRKDFPQKVGLAIVVAAAGGFLLLASMPRWFYLGALILVSAVVIDALLYFFVPKVTVCYRCRSEFRGMPINPRHQPFELSIAEKYRSN